VFTPLLNIVKYLFLYVIFKNLKPNAVPKYLFKSPLITGLSARFYIRLPSTWIVSLYFPVKTPYANGDQIVEPI